MTLKDEILSLLNKRPGLTDREITDALRNRNAPQQPVNIACRSLVTEGRIKREKRNDGLIGNYLRDHAVVHAPRRSENPPPPDDFLSEDRVKEMLQAWLQNDGWAVNVAWGKQRGVDISARRGADLWLIEVKGSGSLQPMRVNYFIGMLGEMLQRMDDPSATYSIAMPDIPQFRGLWDRLPLLAKQRTTITALFVNTDGHVTMCDR